jgi:hypothetical protein
MPGARPNHPATSLALTKKLPPRKNTRGGFIFHGSAIHPDFPSRLPPPTPFPGPPKAAPKKIRSSGRFHLRRAEFLLYRISFPSRLHFNIFVSANQTIQIRKANIQILKKTVDPK